MDFLKHVLNEIKPTEEEAEKVKEIIGNIKKRLKIKGAVVELGGSGRKKTWLRGSHDIDLYAKFDFKKYKSKDISAILEKELKKHFKIINLHGSRDYYQIFINGYTIEVIPILKIKKPNEALNLTDISPFHCEYVLKHDKSDEIMLAKAFCKANNCYGAESYIGGFSGYAMEILTIHYGGFLKLVKGIANWGEKTYIGDKKLIEKLNISKKLSPLILIDPVDKNRNAAAALSYEKYKKFIDACREFLKKPGKELFIGKKFDEKEIAKRFFGKKILFFEVIPLKGKKDVVGAKILKCFNYVKMNFEKNGFKVLDSNWTWNDRALVYFVFDKKDLSDTKVHYGPPVGKVKSAKDFIRKWKKYDVKEDRDKLYVVIKRKFVRPGDFAKNFIKNDKNLKGYVGGVKRIFEKL